MQFCFAVVMSMLRALHCQRAMGLGLPPTQNQLHALLVHEHLTAVLADIPIQHNNQILGPVSDLIVLFVVPGL